MKAWVLPLYYKGSVSARTELGLGIKSRSSMRMIETQFLEPSLLPLRVYTSRRLKLKARERFKSSYDARGIWAS